MHHRQPSNIYIYKRLFVPTSCVWLFRNSVCLVETSREEADNMGKKLDALLGRSFKTSKLKTLVNLAISRLAVFKNQRQVRCSHARTDVIQLLNLGHQEPALLRVEHVIKEQNMLDVFFMIEAYCHLLIERVGLFRNNKECPDELKEAISSLIFATSRCGQFPELQKIREMFTSRFGKEFAARAAELRNNCGVNPKMIQRLSTQQTSFESRLKVLTEIASDNGITVSLEGDAALNTEEKEDVNRKQKQLESNESATLDNPELKDDKNDFPEPMNCGETLSESVKAQKKYRDVASAAQDAFESAAYAAAAARAAVELSRSESWDQDPDNYSGSKHQRRTVSSSDGSSRSKLQVDRNASLEDIKKSNDGLGFDMIHPIDNLSSGSERDEMEDNLDGGHLQEMKVCARKAGMERTLSGSSSDSDGGNLHGSQMSLNMPDWNDQLIKEIVFDGNANESEKPQVDKLWLKHQDLGSGKKFSFPKSKLSKGRKFNAVAGEDNSDEDGNNLYYKSPTRILLKSEAHSPAYSGEGRPTFESTYSSSTADESHSKHS